MEAQESKSVFSLPRLIGAKELQGYLSCSKDTVYTLMLRRDFPSFRIGKRYYVVHDELIKWMDKQTKKDKQS